MVNNISFFHKKAIKHQVGVRRLDVMVSDSITVDSAVGHHYW